MKVLHVITGLSAGGAEQQLASLVRHTRHQPDVLSLTDVGSIGRRMIAEGIDVRALGMRGSRDLPALRRLVAVMRSGAYDVVHVHLYRACVYGRIAARLAGAPAVVTTEHSIGDHFIEGRRKTLGVRLLYLATERLSDVTVAVSPMVRRRLVDWGVAADRIVVVPNGLDVRQMVFDPDARANIRRELGIPPGDMVVGSVGRLHPIKGFDLLVEAAAPMLRDGAWLLLVGEGPERDRLAAAARAHGVESRLRMPGERQDVARMLSAIDVYAAPSREETFGLAALEALAAGLPVVVGQCPALDGADLPALRRTEQDGSLHASLEHAVAATSFAPHRRTCPALVEDRFDIRAVTRAIDDLYERVRAADLTGSTAGRTTYLRGGPAR